jgi:hypothetical protein
MQTNQEAGLIRRTKTTRHFRPHECALKFGWSRIVEELNQAATPCQHFFLSYTSGQDISTIPANKYTTA